jgi:hypothetical protein
MQTPRTVISTAVVAVALGFASPVMAQHHRGGGDGGARGGNRGGSENRQSAVPRASQRPAPAPAPAPAPVPRADNGQRRDYASRPDRSPGNNNNNWRGSASRDQRYAAPRAYQGNQGGGVYRNDGFRNNNGSRNYGYSNNGYRSNGYRGGYYSRSPVRFYHPYYSFRPRFSLGFGLWVGYPVPYAYSYYDPFYGYPYADPYPSTVYPTNPYPAYPPTNYPQSAYPQSAPYGQTAPYPQTVPDPNSIGVQPGQGNVGGLSFDLTPSDAEVSVDGNFVGPVDQFTPSSQPLGLSAGRHRVEVNAPGYQTISFDVNIVAGQVLPYQGSMERR